MTLEIKNLQKVYGDTKAVNDISFSLEKGQVLGLLGRNGAGKTTTIKMMLGLIRPENGSITWDGRPFNRKELSIGYLPEERGLYPKSKVWEQLAYFAELEGVDKKDIMKKIDEWLERFEVMEYKNKLAGDLSKGNQQKIQLIGTMIHNPDIIILDEPFSGLDPVNATMLSNIITEEIKLGKTIILSSHQMNQIETFCENIVMMKSGQIVLKGKLEEIKESYGYKNVTIKTKDDISPELKQLGYQVESEGMQQTVKVKDDAEALTILQKLKESGKNMKSFSVLEPTLHEIFVEKVK